MILVTGSSGFVGSAVVSYLENQDKEIRMVSRRPVSAASSNEFYVNSIDGSTDWTKALAGVNVVIHCAARAHRMNEKGDSFEKYASVNTHGTINLAKSCARMGVRRFVYISTIKVCAEETAPGQSLGPDCALSPSDYYSQTKADAETALQEIAEESELELVIVRPPLVYGPAAKGNLEKLVKLVALGLPLPFGSVNNQRSIVGLENLADFLALTTHHPMANGRIFNISDGDAVSTTHIFQTLSKAMNKRTPLIPVPIKVLKLAARLTGMGAYVDRLTSNLVVDSTTCFELLGWIPPLAATESIASLVEDTSCNTNL